MSVDDPRDVEPMRLYDTARGEVVPFAPGPVVTMYTCGITPYDATHIGHAAVYLTYDVLQRRLRDIGHETRCVRNITDVDDSILGKARALCPYPPGRGRDGRASTTHLSLECCRWERAPRHLAIPDILASSAWSSTGA